MVTKPGDMAATLLIGLKVDPGLVGVAELPAVAAAPELTTEAEATGRTLMGTSRWVFVRESKKTTL